MHKTIILSPMELKKMITEIHEAGFTEKKIGDHVGLDQATIHRLRVGKNKSTNFEAGLEIAALYKQVMRKLKK